jgi:peptidoglycan hydrolase-like protein with peptidoglycan-binding domain
MGYKATVINGTLHLRAGLSEQTAILADIPNNTTIYVKNIHNPTWVMAVNDNQLGYVMQKYLNEHPEQIAYGVEGCERYGDALLQQGCEGNNVVTLQCDLWEYQWRTLAVDGIFGPITRSTVMAYQGMKGLTIDGIVGTETKNRLYADWFAGALHG